MLPVFVVAGPTASGKTVFSIELAEKYGADVEIVELGALLHDIAMPSEFGPREEHNVYGVQIADELLTKNKSIMKKKLFLFALSIFMMSTSAGNPGQWQTF